MRPGWSSTQRVSFRGDGNGGIAVALVTLDLGEDVQGIGVPKRIRPALGGCPVLFEQRDRSTSRSYTRNCRLSNADVYHM